MPYPTSITRVIKPGFGDEHSGQFTRRIQEVSALYQRIKESVRLNHSNECAN
jgi:hypothetical protein